jgi:hypothetical protein
MSLRAIFTKEKTQCIKEVMPERFIVYKVALIGYQTYAGLVSFARYIAPICSLDYLAGEQSVRPKLGCFTTPVVDFPERHASYYPGFHSFVKKSAADEYLNRLSKHASSPTALLSCGIDKEWIIAIGIEGNRDMVVVSNRIIIPPYPKTDITNDKNYLWFFERHRQNDQVPMCKRNRSHGIKRSKKDKRVVTLTDRLGEIVKQ